MIDYKVVTETDLEVFQNKISRLLSNGYKKFGALHIERIQVQAEGMPPGQSEGATRYTREFTKRENEEAVDLAKYLTDDAN